MRKKVGAALVLAVTILTVLCGVLSGCKQQPHMVSIHLIDPLTGKPTENYMVKYKAEDMGKETPIVIKIFDKVWEKYVTDMEYGQDFLSKSITTTLKWYGNPTDRIIDPPYWPTEKGDYHFTIHFNSANIDKLGSWSQDFSIIVE